MKPVLNFPSIIWRVCLNCVQKDDWETQSIPHANLVTGCQNKASNTGANTKRDDFHNVARVYYGLETQDNTQLLLE